MVPISDTCPREIRILKGGEAVRVIGPEDTQGREVTLTQAPICHAEGVYLCTLTVPEGEYGWHQYLFFHQEARLVAGPVTFVDGIEISEEFEVEEIKE